MAGLSKLAGVDASEEDVNALVATTVPLGKVGAKWDIAIAAVFLCSSAARHLTGVGWVSCLVRQNTCLVMEVRTLLPSIPHVTLPPAAIAFCTQGLIVDCIIKALPLVCD